MDAEEWVRANLPIGPGHIEKDGSYSGDVVYWRNGETWYLFDFLDEFGDVIERALREGRDVMKAIKMARS